jgi:hypothetical protein
VPATGIHREDQDFGCLEGALGVAKFPRETPRTYWTSTTAQTVFCSSALMVWSATELASRETKRSICCFASQRAPVPCETSWAFAPARTNVVQSAHSRHLAKKLMCTSIRHSARPHKLMPGSKARTTVGQPPIRGPPSCEKRADDEGAELASLIVTLKFRSSWFVHRV